MALFDGDARKRLWANELFDAGTRRLTDDVYLWVHAIDPTTDVGPYGYYTHLAAIEPLLIGAAYDAAPAQLLNKDGVPDDAPANTRDPEFEPVSISTSTDE